MEYGLNIMTIKQIIGEGIGMLLIIGVVFGLLEVLKIALG
jgi:hypothetical protein